MMKVRDINVGLFWNFLPVLSRLHLYETPKLIHKKWMAILLQDIYKKGYFNTIIQISYKYWPISSTKVVVKNHWHAHRQLPGHYDDIIKLMSEQTRRV